VTEAVAALEGEVAGGLDLRIGTDLAGATPYLVKIPEVHPEEGVL
jgi:hypothetical protein